MELALLVDFGSTYTKVTAIEKGGNLVGTARAFSTVESDIMGGTGIILWRLWACWRR